MADMLIGHGAFGLVMGKANLLGAVSVNLLYGFNRFIWLCRKFSFEAIRGMISPYDPE